MEEGHDRYVAPGTKGPLLLAPGLGLAILVVYFLIADELLKDVVVVIGILGAGVLCAIGALAHPAFRRQNLLGAFVLLLVGLLLVRLPAEAEVGRGVRFGAIALLALAVPATFFFALRSPPLLVVDEHGISAMGGGPVPWDEVESVSVVVRFPRRLVIVRRGRKAPLLIRQRWLPRGDRMETVLGVCRHYRPDLAPHA